MREYEVVHFRDKWYICENNEMVDIGYATKEYAEQCLKSQLSHITEQELSLKDA